MTDAKRPTVEVDLEVYLALRKLAEVAEMIDSGTDCPAESRYLETKMEEAVGSLVFADTATNKPIKTGRLGSSVDWRDQLPEETRQQLERDGYEFRVPPFEHHDCCPDDED